LSGAGFDTAVVRTGEEAVTLLRSDGANYRGLVTDINLLGRFNGWEVAREIDHGLPVVYMSGASADKWPVEGVPNSIILQKPFAPAQLITAVSQLLNDVASGSSG
jgi:DNA-binding response OmpR family regulator